MIAEITKKMIDYFGVDAPRINHALKVYSFAKTIAELEHINQESKTIIEITGLIHDIGIPEAERKHGSSAGNFQEQEGPEVARMLLKDIDELTDEMGKRICFIIGNHHSLSKIDGIDFQILVEADFIVNIFEDSIDKQTAQLICDKYFKTQSGIKILKSMYL